MGESGRRSEKVGEKVIEKLRGSWRKLERVGEVGEFITCYCV